MTEKNTPKKTQKRNSSGGRNTSSAQGLDRVSQDLVRRLPPQNLEAEQAVLGGVFLRNAVFYSLVDLLGEDDFYSPAHRIIFRSFQDLYRQNIPIDLLTVSEHLRKTEDIDAVGGPVYLTTLTESVASAANAEHYAQIVKEKAVRRALIQVGSDMITRSFESGAELEGLLDNAQQEVFAVAESKSQALFQPTRELVKDVFEQLEKRVERQELVTGVATGYHKFDELTGGLQATDLIIIAGRPAMGKTAFALNMGMRAAIMYEAPTAVFSLEMSKQQLMMRMLCSWGKVDLKNLRSGFLDDEDWARLYQSADDLSQAPMYIDDTPALGVMEMRARCRRLKAEKGLSLVIVDYLQLMRASRNIDSREQEISDISRNLKALAKEMDVPVVALAQLNRKVEERTNKRPMISDLRESGAIEQDADLIVFLYREDAYSKNEDHAKKGIAEIIVGKQRNGPIGTVELSFLDRYTAFENLSHIPEPSENVPT